MTHSATYALLELHKLLALLLGLGLHARETMPVRWDVNCTSRTAKLARHHTL